MPTVTRANGLAKRSPIAGVVPPLPNASSTVLNVSSIDERLYARRKHRANLLTKRVRQAGLEQKSIAPGVGGDLCPIAYRFTGEHDDAWRTAVRASSRRRRVSSRTERSVGVAVATIASG